MANRVTPEYGKIPHIVREKYQAHMGKTPLLVIRFWICFVTVLEMVDQLERTWMVRSFFLLAVV
ncbi:MAG TPA: hypothetical protein VGQ59_12290 [Cyclobacteriaceae bacterium]|nr:hypothetical protein [Cyclobacteriaceae bacterium]